MTEVRGIVILHPKTVTKANRLAKERRASLRRPKEIGPEVIRRYRKRPAWMHREVWREAVRLADGDHKRIVLLSSTEALVLNR